MPPMTGSRYMFCRGMRDSQGRLYLSEREPYRFKDHPDNRVHTVVEGDSLFHLAGQYFAPLERACGYWWAIADYQPEPGAIHDPTLRLEPGRRIFIPSIRVLTEIILGESRRRQH